MLTRLANGIPKINAPIVGLPRSAAVTTPAITSPPMIAFSKNSIVLFMSAPNTHQNPKVRDLSPSAKFFYSIIYRFINFLLAKADFLCYVRVYD